MMHIRHSSTRIALAATVLIACTAATVFAGGDRQTSKRLVDMSVRELDSWIKEIKEKAEEKREAREAKEGKKPKPVVSKSSFATLLPGNLFPPTSPNSEEEEESGVDYLEAYLRERQIRSGPDGKPDPNEITDALLHKSRMSPFGKARSAPGNGGGVGILAVGSGNSSKWEFVGPRNLLSTGGGLGPAGSYTSGRINNIAYDPVDSNTAYVATAGGGVWKTIDAGQNWTPLTDFIAEAFVGAAPRPFNRMETSCVTVDPINRNTVFVGTGDYPGSGGGGYGICKSTDGGLTWKVVGAGQMGNSAPSAIVVNPDNPSIVLASTSNGLYRSTDGGETWGASIGTFAGSDITSLSVGVRDPILGTRAYYAAETFTGVYKSTDDGVTWTLLPAPLRLGPAIAFNGGAIEVVASKVNADTVFAYEASTDDIRVYRSDSQGALNTWVDITEGFPDGAGRGDPGGNLGQIWYDRHLTVSSVVTPQGLKDQLYIGTISVAGSFGGQANWTDIGRGYTGNDSTHVDQHGMAFSPTDPNRGILTNDGGVYGFKYDTLTATWVVDQLRLNGTMGVTQFYGADWHPTNPSNMLGGAQDNSTPSSNNDLFNWRVLAGGDGFKTSIVSAFPNIQFATSQFLGVYGTTNNWATTSFIGDPTYNNEPAPFFSVIAADQNLVGDFNGTGVVYTGTDHLWRYGLADSSSDTDPWTGDLGGTTLTTLGIVSAIGVSPTDGNFVYAGTSDGRLWASFNAQAFDATGAFHPATDVDLIELPALPGPILSISVNPNNPWDILVGIGGTGAQRLFRCFNAQSTFPTLAPVSGIQGLPTSLPRSPIHSITRLPSDASNTYIVGMDAGVFISQDGGSTWFDLGAGRNLPPVSVREVKAVAGTGFLNIATFGRGMWRLPLRTLGPAEFTVTPGLRRTGSTQLTANLNILNTGGPATVVNVTNARILPFKAGAGATLTSTSVPVALGAMDADQSKVATVTFTSGAGAPARGSSITVETTIQATTGGRNRTYVKSYRTRMP